MKNTTVSAGLPADVALIRETGLFDLIADLVFIIDSEGCVIYANQAASKALGYQCRELLHISFKELLPSECIDTVSKRMADAVRYGQSIFETAGLRKCRKLMYAEVNARLIISEGEKYILATVRDISRRKKAEEEAVRNVERYRILFEASPVALWEEDASLLVDYLDDLEKRGIVDLRGYFATNRQEIKKIASLIKVTAVNKEAVRLYRAADKDKLVGNLERVIDDFGAFLEAVLTLREGAGFFSAESANRTLDGKRIYIVLRICKVPGFEKRLNRVIVSIADITRIKNAEEALRHSEERYRRLVEQSPDGIVVTVGERIAYVNNTVIRRLGARTAADLVGRSALETIHPDYRVLSGERLRKTQMGEEVEPAREKLLLPSGSVLDVEISSAPVIYEGRRATQSLIRNVTERVQEEERREELIRKLEELNQAKSDFVSRVSHDLRTPLTMIRGYADMLAVEKLGRLAKAQNNAIATIRKQTYKLQRLVDDLLDLSRLESGCMKLERAPVNLEGIVRESLDAFRERYNGKGLYLKLDVAAELPMVSGDVARLTQVMDNLLDNALKFTEKGGVTVSLCRDGNWVRLEVADTGIGITAAENEHVFEAFYQAEPLMTRSRGGTGLGLNIVWGIVHGFGGKVWAESPGKGEGSTIICLLPIYYKRGIKHLG